MIPWQYLRENGLITGPFSTVSGVTRLKFCSVMAAHVERKGDENLEIYLERLIVNEFHTSKSAFFLRD